MRPLTHALRIVFDLQAAQPGVAITVQQKFAIALALGLLNEERPDTSRPNGTNRFHEKVQDFEVILLLQAGERQSTPYLRQLFADAAFDPKIRVWVPPETLESVSVSTDCNLRSVAEIVREAAVIALRPDLLVLPDLFCGLDDRCVASIGMSNNIVPTIAFLPDDEELATLMNRCLDGNARNWILSKLSQLKRAFYWLKINTKAEQGSNLARTLPSNRVSQVTISEPQHLQQAISLIKVLAQESLHGQEVAVAPIRKRKKLAYISPMPPLKTGIASYSAELLPELDKYFDIDLILLQDNCVSEWVDSNSQVRSVAWFMKHAHEYERVLYHFGNSPFHAHMWQLLEQFPGVIVLHDVFLGDAVYYCSESGYAPRSAFSAQLYVEYGYQALQGYIQSNDVSTVFKRYPLSFKLVQSALGVIVHSQHAKNMASIHFGREATESFAVIPHLRGLPSNKERLGARQLLGYAENHMVVCSFGHIVPSKLYLELLDAWFHSSLADEPHCHLVLVGDCQGAYAASIKNKIVNSKFRERIKITGWTDETTFKSYLSIADIAVQLRSDSRGESSGAALDCLAYGIPTICNAHGSLAELADSSILRIGETFSTEELSAALNLLWRQPDKRRELSQKSLAYVQQTHAPWHCADLYATTIEQFYSYPKQIRSATVRCLVPFIKDSKDLLAVTKCLTFSLPNRRIHKQLLVDVTAFAKVDLKTGIQRVTSNILRGLFENPPDGFRVEPVYSAHGSVGYFYARQFAQRFLGFEANVLVDEQVEIHFDDVFLGLDLCLSDVHEQTDWLQDIHNRGARVFFVVYDILPVTHPQWFPASEPPFFLNWLKTISLFDGAICISQATADELIGWIMRSQSKAVQNFDIEVVHIGADFIETTYDTALPLTEQGILDSLRSRQSFLMVGTVEPRKGYAQVLDAFDILWRNGVDVLLTIVGKAGWEESRLLSRLSQHPETNKRLFWLKNIDDRLLSEVYKASTCLIAGAEGEGFGLPLIEAARYGLPIIARDIAVFREVAQEFAYYFSADSGLDLVGNINQWRALKEENKHPQSNGITYSTWEQCCNKYKKFILKLGVPIIEKNSII